MDISRYALNLSLSSAAFDVCMKLIEGERKTVERRTVMLAGYHGIVLDHHRAILTLIRADIPASALALSRPQVETAMRALWIWGCARAITIDRIGRGGAGFPGFEQMVDEVEKELGHPDKPRFKTFKETWGTLNGYTHSGMEQLVCRIRPDGQVKADYDEKTIAVMLDNAGKLSLMVTAFLLLCLKCDSKAEFAVKMDYDLYPRPRP